MTAEMKRIASAFFALAAALKGIAPLQAIEAMTIQVALTSFKNPEAINFLVSERSYTLY